jgi:16S rRNA (guanine966-N2)-methyltransferase
MKSTKNAKPRNSARPQHVIRPKAPHAHEVRIIGGQWKRTKLAVADKPGLRPTPDRVRETLFNWLGQDLTGWRCIDAFAGTGALGFEAASRGAKEVTLVEHDAPWWRSSNGCRFSWRQVPPRWCAVTALPRSSIWHRQAWTACSWTHPLTPIFLSQHSKPRRRAVTLEGFVYLEAPLLWSQDKLAMRRTDSPPAPESGRGACPFAQAPCLNVHLKEDHDP